MAFLDAKWAFDTTPKNLNVGSAAQISTNVHDAGAALRVFGGHSQRPPRFMGHYKITAGTGTLSFRAQLVAAEAADGTTGAEEVIADTGIQLLDADGNALAIGDVVRWDIPVVGQRSAKRYYVAFYTQGTADQDGEVTSYIALDGQSNMVYDKLATP